MNLFFELRGIFRKITLKYCDSSENNLLESREMSQIAKLIPIWSIIIEKGLIQDKAETLRTLRHIFRSLWVYYTILEDCYEIEIKKENLSKLKALLEKIRDKSLQFFPLLILFHDIGRPFNRESHAQVSANLLRQFNALDEFLSDPLQKTVLEGVIKNHLLPGTIFTGESSYYSAISVLRDESLKEIWTTSEEIDFFFDTLQAFTLIDIWGYDYAKVFDHYFLYYPLICNTLSNGFKKFQPIEPHESLNRFYREFSRIDEENLKWRVSCALRIFQFVDTQEYLSKEFFFEKIGSALAEGKQTWNEFADSISKEHSRLQFNYALPIMIVLALGFISREPIQKETNVKEGIFKFWEKIANVARKLGDPRAILQKNCPSLFNIMFEIPRGWFLDPNRVRYILSDKFFSRLERGTIEYNQISNSVSVKIEINF